MNQEENFSLFSRGVIQMFYWFNYDLIMFKCVNMNKINRMCQLTSEMLGIEKKTCSVLIKGWDFYVYEVS